MVIFTLASHARLFLHFCPFIWGIVLWGALVASRGSFGWPVVFQNFMEFSLSWSMRVVGIEIEIEWDWVPTNYNVFLCTFLRSLLIPLQWDESRYHQQTWSDPCFHCLRRTIGIFSLLIVNLVALGFMSRHFDGIEKGLNSLQLLIFVVPVCFQDIRELGK